MKGAFMVPFIPLLNLTSIEDNSAPTWFHHLS